MEAPKASLVAREVFLEEGLSHEQSPGGSWVCVEGARPLRTPKLGSGFRDKIYCLSDLTAEGREGSLPICVGGMVRTQVKSPPTLLRPASAHRIVP